MEEGVHTPGDDSYPHHHLSECENMDTPARVWIRRRRDLRKDEACLPWEQE